MYHFEMLRQHDDTGTVQPSFISLFSLHLEKHLVNLLDDVDHSFFDRIKMNSEHVRQPYLPERPEICYSLRQRSHNKDSVNQNSLPQ